MMTAIIANLEKMLGGPRDGALLRYSLGNEWLKAGDPAANPFPIVIPCHRVIRSDGSLGGYGGGLAMKKALLAMEAS